MGPKPLSAKAFSQTYPSSLRQAGYRTGYLGKFTIGQPFPEIRHLSLSDDRFDLWFGFPQTISYFQKVDGKPKYLTTLMEGRAIEFLRTQPRDQPFCLVVALKEPHGPVTSSIPTCPTRTKKP